MGGVIERSVNMENKPRKRLLTMSKLAPLAGLFVLASIWAGPYYRMSPEASALNNPVYTTKAATEGEPNLVRDTLQNMHRETTIDNYTSINTIIPLTLKQRKNSEELLKLFESTLSRDASAKGFPFNEKYLQDALGRTHALLAKKANTRMFGQKSFHSLRNSRAVFNTDPEANPEINDINSAYAFNTDLAHELGHGLGFGESLTCLFAEVITGNNSKPGFPQYAIGEEKEHIFEGWEYYSGFDRALLQKRTLEKGSEGEKEFWTAALSGQAAYEKLWNDNLGSMASFNNMQLARSVLNAGEIDYQKIGSYVLPDSKDPAHDIRAKIREITRKFNSTLDPSNPNGAKDKEDVNAFFTKLAEYAQKNYIPPKPAVYDYKVLKTNSSLSDKARNILLYPSQHTNEFLFLAGALFAFGLGGLVASRRDEKSSEIAHIKIINKPEL